jgi:hypothetical protein
MDVTGSQRRRGSTTDWNCIGVLQALITQNLITESVTFQREPVFTYLENLNKILRPTTKLRVLYSMLNLVVGRKLYFYFTTYNEIENTI